MFPFVGSCGVSMTRTGGEAGNAGGTGAAILAFVSGFVVALVKRVFAFVGTEGMTVAGARREAGNRGGFGSAVFAVRHRVLGRLWYGNVASGREVRLAGEVVKATRPTRTGNLRHEVSILRPVQNVDVCQIQPANKLLLGILGRFVGLNE